MIKDIDSRCRYLESHEWARPANGEYEVGISPHAENSLGDVVFVELPAVGAQFKKGSAFGVIESVKAASDLYIPLSGTITAVNTKLKDNPALINADCYGEGWIVRFKASDPGEWESLLAPEAYSELIAEA